MYHGKAQDRENEDADDQAEEAGPEDDQVQAGGTAPADEGACGQEDRSEAAPGRGSEQEQAEGQAREVCTERAEGRKEAKETIMKLTWEIVFALAGTGLAAFGAFTRNVLIVGAGATLIGLALIAAWMIVG
jgi:hypothetical protein